MNYVHVLSRRMVLPEPITTLPPEAKSTIDLTPWALSMIILEYNPKGFVLPKPPITVREGHLASSFARALGRFYPYAGRLAVAPKSDGDREKGESIVISLHCSMKGAESVHAMAPGVTVADITTPLYTPRVVRCFFPLDALHGVDAAAGSLALLAAQVTELDDGIFVAMLLKAQPCCRCDGATLSNLFNTWSKNSRGSDGAICLPLPVHRRWFLAGCPVPVPLPFGKLEDILVNRRTDEHPSSAMEEGFLNFSAEKVKKLKAKASAEVVPCRHLWMTVCRARRLSPHHRTAHVMAVGCRGRVDGLPAAYAAGEILERGLGWTATLLERGLGWGGRPVGVRNGPANKMDGTATALEGRGGGGSMVLEVLARLVADEEFLTAVSAATP